MNDLNYTHTKVLNCSDGTRLLGNSIADVELGHWYEFGKVKCWRKKFWVCCASTSCFFFSYLIIYMRTNVNAFQEMISNRKKANRMIVLEKVWGRAARCIWLPVNRIDLWPANKNNNTNESWFHKELHFNTCHCLFNTAILPRNQCNWGTVRSIPYYLNLYHRFDDWTQNFDNDASHLCAVDIVALRIFTKQNWYAPSIINYYVRAKSSY